MSISNDPRHSIVRDERPWGWFRQFAHNTPCTVKLIQVNAGQSLSLQYHHGRDEMWVALDDGLTIEIDGEVAESREGDVFFIPRGATHRVSAGDRDGRFLEVAFGHFDEQDIVRVADEYGRD